MPPRTRAATSADQADDNNLAPTTPGVVATLLSMAGLGRSSPKAVDNLPTTDAEGTSSEAASDDESGDAQPLPNSVGAPALPALPDGQAQPATTPLPRARSAATSSPPGVLAGVRARSAARAAKAAKAAAASAPSPACVQTRVPRVHALSQAVTASVGPSQHEQPKDHSDGDGASDTSEPLVSGPQEVSSEQASVDALFEAAAKAQSLLDAKNREPELSPAATVPGGLTWDEIIQDGQAGDLQHRLRAQGGKSIVLADALFRIDINESTDLAVLTLIELQEELATVGFNLSKVVFKKLKAVRR